MYPSLILSFLRPLKTLDFSVYYFFALSFIISLLRVLTLIYIFLNSVFTFVKQISKHKLEGLRKRGSMTTRITEEIKLEYTFHLLQRL